MNIVFGIIMAILWGAAGLVVGAAFGYAFNLNLASSLLFGAIFGGGLGFVYGILTPTTSLGTAALKLNGKGRLALEKCAWCQGTGVEGQKKSPRSCRVCLGEGRVLTEQPTRFCPRCKGKGRRLAGRRCQQCEGSGLNSFFVFERSSRSKGQKKQKKKRRWGWRISTM